MLGAAYLADLLLGKDSGAAPDAATMMLFTVVPVLALARAVLTALSAWLVWHAARPQGPPSDDSPTAAPPSDVRADPG